jgi:predicted Zn-dependent protease
MIRQEAIMSEKNKTLLVIRAFIFFLFALVSTGLSQNVPAQNTQKNEPFAFTKVELSLLEQCDLLDRRFEKEGLVYTDEALNAYLAQIGKSIIPPGEPPEHVQWRFRVLRDPATNAFALPNGSIYLHSGILSSLENESQLAAVIGHEVAHVLGRHSYKENRSYRKKIAAINVIGTVARSVPGGGVASVIALGAASTARIFLTISIYHHSQDLEREADLFAAERLLDSNYDPKEMLALFKLLDRDYDVEQIEPFYSDHPKLQERIAYVDQLLKSKSPNAVSVESLAAARTRYLMMTEKISRHDIQLNFDNRRYRTALARSQKLVNFNPNSSENMCYLADSYRLLGPNTMEPTGEELSPDGRKKLLEMKRKLTPDEEERTRMETAAGQSAWKTNRADAEEQYRKALELDAYNAVAHRGLGMLYERMEKPQQAIEEYRKYLELKPDASDRMIIQRRLDALPLK